MKLKISHPNQLPKETKGLWIVILHPNRTPPHVGLIFNNNYCSLNIKGREIDIKSDVLMKTLIRQKTESLFIELYPHPVFSCDYLKENFIIHLEKFNKVENLQSTCFTPVKLFFQENLYLNSSELCFLKDLFPQLLNNNFIQRIYSFNIENMEENKEFDLPSYSEKELKNRLEELN